MNNDELIDIKRLIKILRRQLFLITTIIALFVGLALVYLVITPAEYTAKAFILLDKSVTQTVSEISSIKQMGFETAAIESEVEIIKSKGVTKAVIKKLSEKGYFLNKPESENEELIVYLLKNLKVTRVGETYVLSVAFTSDDPEKAANIANTYAETYISEQLKNISEMSNRTASWLQIKIKEINQQVLDAKQAVADFRTAYNKIQLNRNTSDNQKVGEEIGLTELRNLEKEAEAYSALYEIYLEKLKAISIQESFPVTETRIITRASPPSVKSHPKALLILGAAIILGTGLGILTALLIDNFDKSLKRAGQVKREIGVPFLGFFPKREKANTLKFLSRDGKEHKVNLHTESISDPFALQSEVVRTILNELDHYLKNQKKKVVGIISSDQETAKNVISSNLAVYASQSAPTLLVDGDIRSPAHFLATPNSKNTKGLGDLLLNKVSLEDTLLYEEGGNLAILESFNKDLDKWLTHFNADNIKALIETAKKSFDLVIIDFPPLLSPADIYSFTQAVDCFVIIAEWGKTLSNNLNFHLKQNDIHPEKTLGVILENANMKKMKKFYGHKVYS